MYENLVYSTGMMLLHSIWQFTLLLLVLKVVLFVLKNASPELRYRLAGAGLLLSLLIAMITFGYYFFVDISLKEPVFPFHEYSFSYIQNSHETILDPAPGHSSKVSLVKSLPYIVPLYYAGLVILISRLILSFIFLFKKRNTGVHTPDPRVLDIFNELYRKFHLRKRIVLKESVNTKIPLAFGYWKPIIIIPAGMFLQMPVYHLEAVISHELAHIRRSDYLINLIQLIIETLFFYHPAIYFISRYMREEREICCDKCAINYCSDPAQYVKALAGLDSAVNHNLEPALAFDGNRNNLLNRIKKILNPNNMKTRISDRIIAAAVILTGIVTFLLTGAATWSNFSGEHSKRIENVSASLNSHSNQGYFNETKDTIIDFDTNRVVIMRENENKKEEKIEISFRDGKINQVKVNGELVPEEKYREYADIIHSSKEDIKKASNELSKAEDELNALDTDEINRKIEKAIIEAREMDQEKIRMEIEKAKAELEKIDHEKMRKETEEAMKQARIELEKAKIESVNFDSISDAVSRALASVNWEQINYSIQSALEQANMNEEEIKQAMEEAQHAMEAINWDQINQSIEEGVKEAHKSMEAIDWDSLRETINLSLDVSFDALKDISFDIQSVITDLEGIDVESKINSAKAEINQEKERLEELEKNMEQALEELEKK